MASRIFINLAVSDISKTKAFFSALGFVFNPQFTNDKAACLIIGENMYAMLITKQYFKTFTPNKAVADATKTTEVLTAIQLESRKAVDDMYEKALANGGKQARSAEDHGWMYAHAFEDLDGHIWEPFFADEMRKED